MATRRNPSKADLKLSFPYILQPPLLETGTNCRGCDWPIAGDAVILEDDASGSPFCRPECAWEWAKETGINPRDLPKTAISRRRKNPQPLEKEEDK